MNQLELYTAIGHLRVKRHEDGGKYPVIEVNRRDYPVDPQELAVWSTLCWRVCDAAEIHAYYHIIYLGNYPPECRTLEGCVLRLETRGLIAKGIGACRFDALYDLIRDLYVMPVCEKLSLRWIAFFRMVFTRGVSVRKAAGLFLRDERDMRERQVMSLSSQALLSTAELIKCVEVGAEDVSTDENLMDALYADTDTTSDNIGLQMRASNFCIPVTIAVANLYLRKQIVLQRI